MPIRRLLVGILGTLTLTLSVLAPSPAQAVNVKPTISSISPNVGGPSGGTKVTIQGTNFTKQSAVKFNGIDANKIRFISSTELYAWSPRSTVKGYVHIQVFNGAKRSVKNVKARFMYARTPVVTKLTPARGSTNGGTTVRIKGKYFTPDSVVRFGGKKATSVIYKSPTELIAQSPSRDAGAVQVEVANASLKSEKGPRVEVQVHRH